MFAPKVPRSPSKIESHSRPTLRAASALSQLPGITPVIKDLNRERKYASGPVRAADSVGNALRQVEPLPALHPRITQPKLKVGAVDDPLEMEADQAAEKIMQMDSASSVLSSAAPKISRKCAACKREEEESPATENQIRRKCAHCEEEDRLRREPDRSATPVSSRNDVPPLVQDVLRSPGQPLTSEDLEFFEPRFGFDLSRVRIHSDQSAAESAHAVDALAYTYGTDIAFAAGQYRPATESGRRLLAHELAHVVQQSSGDSGYVRRLGDLSKVPAVLSCGIAPSNVPADHEFVLFPNRGTSLSSADKIKIGEYVNRYYDSGSSNAVRVDGFASEPGDDTLNWMLSCYRASAVKDELEHPSVAKFPGLPEASIAVYMQGETAEFGAEALNRRATLSPRITGSSQGQPTPDTGKPTPEGTGSGTGDGGASSGAPTDAGQGETPMYRPSCAVNPSCPDDYCLPFPTRQQALDDRASNAESVLSRIATASSHAEPLFRKYVFSPGPAGDISAEYGPYFSSSMATRYASEEIHPLVEADIKSHPPAFPADGSWATVDYETDASRDALKQKFNQLANDDLVFTDPFEVPGLIAGGVGKDQGFCNVGANTSGAQEDSRSARVSAQVFKNPDGTMVINPIVYYTVVDTVDFCPGNCGGFFAQNLGHTIEMSRWEASGISGDVPFTVKFQGPSLIGAYNSEDE
jgi:outer membrane protein OmpA-like peptidoglycan-associated protein